MAWKHMKSLPIGDVILCFPDGHLKDEYNVAQAHISRNPDDSIYINVLAMDSHGCGCCADNNPIPIAWDHRPKPPKWLGETDD